MICVLRNRPHLAHGSSKLNTRSQSSHSRSPLHRKVRMIRVEAAFSAPLDAHIVDFCPTGSTYPTSRPVSQPLTWHCWAVPQLNSAWPLLNVVTAQAAESPQDGARSTPLSIFAFICSAIGVGLVEYWSCGSADRPDWRHQWTRCCHEVQNPRAKRLAIAAIAIGSVVTVLCLWVMLGSQAV